jgi:hypothetical protein
MRDNQQRSNPAALVAASLSLLTLFLICPARVSAQWTQDGSGNINNTNPGNVKVGGAGTPTSVLHTKGNLSSQLTGTVAVTQNSMTVNGTGTAFTTELAVGDSIKIGTSAFTVSAISSATSLTLDANYTGTTASGLSAFRDPSLFSIDNGAGVSKLTVDRSGKVGIGTATPSSRLSIVEMATTPNRGIGITQYSSDTTAALLNLTKLRGTPSAAVSVADGDTLGSIFSNAYTGGYLSTAGISFLVNGTVSTTAAPTDILFRAGATGFGLERMRITSAGNVGIGTAAPAQRLQIGSNSITGSTTPDAISLGASYSSAAGANPKLRLFDDNAGSIYGLGSSDHQLDFMVPATSRYVWYFNGAEKMRLDGSGGLGIGKTPGAAYKLDVNGSVNGTGFCIGGVCKSDWSQVGQWTPGSGSSIYYNGGNVGIGTSTPLQGLVGNGGMELYVTSAVATFRIGTGLAGKNNAQVRFSGASGDNWAIGSDVATNSGSRDFHFYDFAGTPGARLTIQSSTGNVGIGTNAPSTAKLVISGTAGSPGIDLASSDVYAEMRVIRNSLNAGDKDLYLQYQAGVNSKTHIYSSNAETVTVSGGKVGIGNNNPGVALDVAGAINATGAITGATVNATYQDVAEWVPSTQKLSAGTVVVLDSERTNHVLASTTSYDTKVAGVISARPGIALGEGGEGKSLVATTGRVKVKVDATRSPIKVGDLLVTSDVEGVAMRSEPIEIGGRKMHAPGTIIGKALEPLASGTGEILVLLSLQ